MHKSSNINTLRAVINDFLISSIAQAFPELDNHSINPVLEQDLEIINLTELWLLQNN